MASRRPQYHHYIPRFILKEFVHTKFETSRQTVYIPPDPTLFLTDADSRPIRDRSRPEQQMYLHVFDLPSEQFRLEEVGKTCGEQNLYDNADDSNPRRVEQLFSRLESTVNLIFRKISTAVAEGCDHIDVLEKDVHVLFKFMHISQKRSAQFRDRVKSPYRENDFMFQQIFEESRKRGRSGNPEQVWLETLLYLLEATHEQLLADAEKSSIPSSAGTYKHFTERYALQIWRAADGYEFFFNERLVDFEGDTTSCLGVEEGEIGSQLIWMTKEDMIHLVLPINPEVAIIFCDESRCWESPFANAMHRAKIPYLNNSLLKNAPHKDIINVDKPSEKRGRKMWPATVAWRVSIGNLSRQHHRIIASYSLVHAQSVLVVRCRARFERARRELDEFKQKREETWKTQGIRFGYAHDRPHQTDRVLGLSEERINRMADNHMAALLDISNLVATSRKPVPRSKESSIKCWQAILALEVISGTGPTLSSSSDGTTPKGIIHPGLKMAFKTAYPPKHPDHRDLIEIDFFEFVYYGVGEETFVKLSDAIDKKIQELVDKDCFKTHFDAGVQQLRINSGVEPAATTLFQEADFAGEGGEDVLENPCFKSIYVAAQGFDVLRWMFMERQDILATFVRQIAVPMAEMQPSVVRLRARRE